MMTMRSVWLPILALGLRAITSAQTAEPVMLAEAVSSGSVRVSPESGVSAQLGTWVVTYTVGDGGIAEGGGLRVQLPDAWHSGPRNSAIRVQATDPADDHYVTASCSRAGVALETIVENETDRRLVKHEKNSLDGRRERYVFVVRVKVLAGRLEPGDTISIVYGDRSGGSQGYLASAVSMGPRPILVAVDSEGNDRFALHTDRRTLTALPGPPAELQFHAPSRASVGEPARLLLSLLDKETNPAPAAVTISIFTRAGEAIHAAEIVIPAGKSFAEFTIEPRTPGIVRLEARADALGLTARANPIEVSIDPLRERIYWGDLHSHTRYSWDGVGSGSFDYARYTAGLDFYAMTDHSRTPRDGLTRGLSPSTWPEYTALTERNYEPDRFVTLHAYECSFGRPFGHHNVFFRGEPGPLLAPSSTNLPRLWEALSQGEALTIPHHTGKFPRGVDFSIHDARFRRNFEIYSGHGLSESFDPEHPLAFEHSLFTSDSSSLDEPTHAQDVWEAGLALSTVAASDDHRARPGQTHYGLTAVRASSLTRASVFDALYERATYGTTGAKIILDFSIDGTPMGQTAKVGADPRIEIRAIGTDEIERVELLRYRPGEEDFRIIAFWQPEAWEFETDIVDTDYEAGAIYYTRLRQANEVRGRIVMAWSSPIWTE